MTKQLIDIEDLSRLVLDTIRRSRSGSGVLEISIYEVEDIRLGRNWDITIVLPGCQGRAAVCDAALAVARKLGRRFDLQPENIISGL